MLTYLILVSTSPRGLPPAARRDLTRLRTSLLVHEPEETCCYLSPDERSGFVGWQTNRAAVGTDHWYLDARGSLTAFAGWPWSRTAERLAPPLNESLADMVDRHGMQAVHDRMTGTFQVVRLNCDGSGFVAADDLGTGLIYVAEKEGYLAVSNSVDLAASAGETDTPPVRDAGAMAWMPLFGFFLDERSSYLGVSVLPTGSGVVLSPEGASITPARRPWTALDPPSLAEVGAELIAQIDAASRMPAEVRRVRLSGGKDSRLVLAAIAAAGLLGDFEFHTVGFDDDPDVVVAHLLADELGLDIVHRVPRRHEIDTATLDRAIRRHVSASSGMFGIWDLKSVEPGPHVLTISGLGGELMRSHYKPRRILDSEEAALRYLRGGLRLDAADLFREDERAHYVDEVVHWGAGELEAGTEPADLADVFYAEYRMRRWMGAAQHLNTWETHLDPLTSSAMLRAGIAAGARARRSDTLHLQLISMLHEPLAKIPIAADGWHRDALAATPNSELYALPPVPRETPRPRRWQDRGWPEFAPMFEAQLIHRENQVLYEYLDRGKVRAAIDNYQQLTRQGVVNLWAALGTAIWLNHGEEPVAYPRHRGRAAPEFMSSVRDPLLFVGPAATDVLPRGDRDAATDVLPRGDRDLIQDWRFGAVVDAELERLCDDLLVRCDATVDSLPDDLSERMASRDTAGLAQRALELLSSRGGILAGPRLGLTLPFWQHHLGCGRAVFVQRTMADRADVPLRQLDVDTIASLTTSQMSVAFADGADLAGRDLRSEALQLQFSQIPAIGPEELIEKLLELPRVDLAGATAARVPTDARIAFQRDRLRQQLCSAAVAEQHAFIAGVAPPDTEPARPVGPAERVEAPEPSEVVETDRERVAVLEAELLRLRNRKSVRWALWLAGLYGRIRDRFMPVSR